MPVPRGSAAIHACRSERRLLLPRLHRHGHRRHWRVHPRKQYAHSLSTIFPSPLTPLLAFPFAVFIIYGTHWGSLAYNQDPIHQVTSAFPTSEGLGGATGAPYESSQVFHNITMCMVSFVFMIGTLRVNALFVLLFFGLTMLFAFIAAADAAAPTATSTGHILTLLKCAGGFGFIGLVCGW